MSDITPDQLYELYCDTLSKCTGDLRNRTDEELEHNLFEEFDVGAHSFLHDESLIKLHRAQYIDDEMLSLARQVRERWLALQNTTWTVQDIRSKKEWEDLFRLCDELRTKAVKKGRACH
jgi:hypothetical protein